MIRRRCQQIIKCSRAARRKGPRRVAPAKGPSALHPRKWPNEHSTCPAPPRNPTALAQGPGLPTAPAQDPGGTPRSPKAPGCPPRTPKVRVARRASLRPRAARRARPKTPGSARTRAFSHSKPRFPRKKTRPPYSTSPMDVLDFAPRENREDAMREEELLRL